MQKRKAKFNIIDLAIILVVICALAVLGFKNYIIEFFEEPQITKTTATVTLSNVSADTGLKLKNGDSLEFYPESDADGKTKIRIINISYDKHNTAVAEIEFKGYSKFGRIYTEQGELIRNNSEFMLQKSDKKVKCLVKSVRIG